MFPNQITFHQRYSISANLRETIQQFFPADVSIPNRFLSQENKLHLKNDELIVALS